MQKGDKVRFLSEKGGGIVAGFQGKDIVLVEDPKGAVFLLEEILCKGKTSSDIDKS